ncbi:inositolphosphorylceramide synthase [Pseudohyphozyma bogoriensis]|nr:inositolphosphorylceramide synthase [Pseudohyphozyma bogoriensis]
MPRITLRIPHALKSNLISSVSRLELTFDPRIGVARVRRYKFDFWTEIVPYSFLAFMAGFSLLVMHAPIAFKLFLIAVYTLSLLVPFTGQFTLPATPVFAWLIFYFSSKFIPTAYRPHIWVSVLPTLESVLYGANISDILTRWTHPVLDICAWLPYGIVHFVGPFVVAAVIFVFGPPGAVKFFGSAFGYLNLVGVMIQIAFPSAPPWYELRNGLVPANYGMKGSPGGLARIDAIFGGQGYTNTFSNAPVPFGAFPSLHAGCSTMNALFLTHFFPQYTGFYWAYVSVLYWSTMYLTHHYLIDLVAGGSLAVTFFYILLPAEYQTSNPAKDLNVIPLDPEIGKRTSVGSGYGGWVGGDDEADDFDAREEFK